MATKIDELMALLSQMKSKKAEQTQQPQTQQTQQTTQPKQIIQTQQQPQTQQTLADDIGTTDKRYINKPTSTVRLLNRNGSIAKSPYIEFSIDIWDLENMGFSGDIVRTDLKNQFLEKLGIPKKEPKPQQTSKKTQTQKVNINNLTAEQKQALIQQLLG